MKDIRVIILAIMFVFTVCAVLLCNVFHIAWRWPVYGGVCVTIILELLLWLFTGAFYD